MLKVEIFYILLGIFIAVLFVYALRKPPRVIMKYPTIEQLLNKTYKDNQGNCYRFSTSPISC